MTTIVGYYNQMCIKLKASQVNKSHMLVYEQTMLIYSFKCIMWFLYMIATYRKSHTQLS